MSYWDEVKRIQVSMRSASIYTNEASDIIDGITGKHGYLFTIDKIYNAVPIEEIRKMISEAKKRGGHDAALAVEMEAAYAGAGPFVPGEELTKAEINDKKDELDNVIRQLEAEVNECIRKHKEKKL